MQVLYAVVFAHCNELEKEILVLSSFYAKSNIL